MKIPEKLNEIYEIYNNIQSRVDLYNITSVELESLSLDTIYTKINSSVIVMADLYYKKNYMKFNLAEFHINKSKLFIACSSLLSIQKSLIINPLLFDPILVFFKKFKKANPINIKFVCIAEMIINDMMNKKYYNMQDIKFKIIDEILNIIKDDHVKNYDHLRVINDVGTDIIIQELEDLRYTHIEYVDKLKELYNKVIMDCNYISNCYPAYHSRYLDIENNLEESIKNLIFKDIDIFKEILPILPILPENDFVLNDEHITPIIVKHKRMRLFQREIPTFTKNVLSKFIDLIKYKNYKKDKSNLEYIIG